jgi:hypothetical protein
VGPVVVVVGGVRGGAGSCGAVRVRRGAGVAWCGCGAYGAVRVWCGAGVVRAGRCACGVVRAGRVSGAVLPGASRRCRRTGGGCVAAVRGATRAYPVRSQVRGWLLAPARAGPGAPRRWGVRRRADRAQDRWEHPCPWRAVAVPVSSGGSAAESAATAVRGATAAATAGVGHAGARSRAQVRRPGHGPSPLVRRQVCEVAMSHHVRRERSRLGTADDSSRTWPPSQPLPTSRTPPPARTPSAEFGGSGRVRWFGACSLARTTELGVSGPTRGGGRGGRRCRRRGPRTRRTPRRR